MQIYPDYELKKKYIKTIFLWTSMKKDCLKNAQQKSGLVMNVYIYIYKLYERNK